MSLDFFKTDCQEPSFNHMLFGICDDGMKAYTDISDDSKWIARVKNESKVTLVFTAIDGCVIKKNEYPGRGRCDAILTSSEHIYFIELKDQAKDWITDAREQLESTVQLFIEKYGTNGKISGYKHKKAFACNKRHRHFQEIDNELNLKFFRTYGVRIDVQADIIII